ncbi:MAG TPA: methyltransferase domain-containing protein [Myxococcaceae bacterium]|jgi:SAM-dependent methyltransferase
MKRPYQYVLGDSRVEAARLRAQARLWDPVAHALFDRLKVRRGWKVLEVGPGEGSLHLELRRRIGGPADAVERSERFTVDLRRACARDGFGEGNLWQCDLADAPLPAGRYDLIFARWVFLFLPEPEKHLRQLVRALKPGGVIALQDYHRETLAMIPPPRDWKDFVTADRALFATQGGNASIGDQLPGMFRRAGLKVTGLDPEIKYGHPGSPTWEWVTGYFMSVMEKLGKLRPFTPAKAARLRREWIQAGRDPSSLLVAPAVLSITGRKPRRS